MNLEALWYWCSRICVAWTLWEIASGRAMSAFLICASGATFFLLGRREEKERMRNDFHR